MKNLDALKLLEECEQNLRKVLAEVVREGDYSGVLRITDWARALAAMVAEARSDQPSAGNSFESKAGREAKQNSTSATSMSNGRRRRPDPVEYPKFFRRGDELIKVGWSKKDRREYKHRAPREAVDAVAVAVREVGARGRLFNGDALLPLKGQSGGVVPDYQAYVALAWLKELGVVEQRGRKAGYSLARNKQIESAITAAWPELDEWRG